MNFNARMITITDLMQATQELSEINCESVGIKIMSPKAVFKTIKLEKIPAKAANLLKQTFLAKGGEVAVARGAADLSVQTTDVLICATIKQYRMAISQLKMQPWGLPKIAETLDRVLKNADTFPKRHYNWCKRQLFITPGRTLVMGILNVTPDSFSDGGKFSNIDSALRHADQMIKDGVDIIDIGAESTRPYGGAKPVTAEEEIERLIPVLTKILSEFDIPISVDTYKAVVAETALKHGAHIINDVYGLKNNEHGNMAEVAAKYNVPVIIMHNNPSTYYERDIMSHIVQYLQESIDIALQNGILFNNIIIDPGIGFGKNSLQNLAVLMRISELKGLGCPILLGTSRKRFLGEVMSLDVNERVEGTGATVALGIQQGANIVRVHDVKEMVRVARTTDAILKGEFNG